MSNHYCRANLESAVLLYKQGLKDDAINILIEAFSEFEDQKREIMETQNRKCLGCNVTLDNYYIHHQFDHIIPHCEGGPTTIENGRALCRNCHKSNNLQWFKEALVNDYKKRGYDEDQIKKIYNDRESDEHKIITASSSRADKNLIF